VDDKEYVLVETIETFRIRYLVPVPKGNADWALDTVAMDEGTQFSQLYLGETIVSHRVVSFDEAIALADEDNEWAVDWPVEQKVKAFFTPEIQDDGRMYPEP